MLIKKQERVKHINSPRCIAYEYLHKDKDISIALVEISGRYPDEGFVMNKVVKELIFVAEGKGKVVISDREHKLGKDDALLIQPKQKYFFEGNFKLVISSHPAWTPQQHTKVV